MQDLYINSMTHSSIGFIRFWGLIGSRVTFDGDGFGFQVLGS